MRRRAIRPRASWAIVPLAVLVGAGAGYGVGVAADTDKVGATAIGAAVGLLAGAVFLFAWLQTHPRVSGPGGAYKLTGIPTTGLDDISKETAAGLLQALADAFREPAGARGDRARHTGTGRSRRRYRLVAARPAGRGGGRARIAPRGSDRRAVR